MKFRIYRFQPEQHDKPWMQDYELENIGPGMMLRDALLRLKEQCESLIPDEWRVARDEVWL